MEEAVHEKQNREVLKRSAGEAAMIRRSLVPFSLLCFFVDRPPRQILLPKKV